MSAEKSRDPHNQREELLAAMTLPCRKTMLALAGNPDAAAEWHNKLADVRAGIMVGREIMEATARVKAGRREDDPDKKRANKAEADLIMTACMYALGVTTALESCMSAIAMMHPNMMIRARVTDDPIPPGKNGHTGFSDGPRILDLE